MESKQKCQIGGAEKDWAYALQADSIILIL